MMKIKELFLCKALDRFKEMISNDECSRADIDCFCSLSRYEHERRKANADRKQWVDKKEACEMLGVSRATLDRMVVKGELTKGKKAVGKKTLVWKSEDIEQLQRILMLKVK